MSSTPYLDEDGDSRDDLKEQIHDWFFENFEEPSEHMPRDPSTGEYEWIWGGPFDARDEIEDAFIAFDSELIDEAVDELGSSTSQWAPHIDRVVEITDNDIQVASYGELQDRLSELEKLIGEIAPRAPGIGGNNPPEEIGVPPYDDDDEQELRGAIATLRQPQPELTADVVGHTKAAETIKSKGEKIRDFLGRHGDKFASSFADQMGKRVADSLTLATWIKFSAALFAVYEAARGFAAAIGQMQFPF